MTSEHPVNLTRRTMRHPEYEAFYFDHRYEDPVRVHYHDGFYEVYFFLSGEVCYHIGDAYYPLAPGSVLLIAPHVRHWPVLTSGGGRYMRMFLWLDCAYLASLSSEATDLAACFAQTGNAPVLRLSEDVLHTCRDLFLQLLAVQEAPRYGSDLYAKSLILQLMLHINMAHQSIVALPSPDKRKRDFVSQVIAYIHEHIEESLSLDVLAQAFYVSKSFLSKQFFAQLGITVHQYIVKRRMLVAQQLLTEGVSPTRVFAMVGYSEYSAFYKAYVKAFGKNPMLDTS